MLPAPALGLLGRLPDLFLPLSPQLNYDTTNKRASKSYSFSSSNLGIVVACTNCYAYYDLGFTMSIDIDFFYACHW